MAHLVTAIIKPFKLEEVKEALRGAGRPRPHRHRGPGLRPPGRQDRDVPRLGVQDRLRAQGQDRGAGRLGRRRQGDRRARPRRPAPARSVTARSGPCRSATPCGSAPARWARTRCSSGEAVPRASLALPVPTPRGSASARPRLDAIGNRKRQLLRRRLSTVRDSTQYVTVLDSYCVEFSPACAR